MAKEDLLETLLVELKAEVSQYGKDLKAATESTARATTNIERDFSDLSKEIQTSSKEINKAVNSTQKPAKEMGKVFDWATGTFKALEKEVDDAADEIKTLGKESEKAGKSASTSFDVLKGVVGGGLLLGAFQKLKGAAGSLFDLLITDGVAAAQVQEDAINALESQLRLTGELTEETSQDFQTFASDLQSVSKVGDETTLQMLALAKTFGKTNAETKNLVSAAVELSAATGMTLDGAVRQLGKSYSGLSGELGEAMPAIRALTAEQLKSGEAINLIIDRFGGTASAQLNTFSGSVQHLKNTWGDATEEIGFAITKNEVIIQLIKDLDQAIADAIPQIGAFADHVINMVTGGQDKRMALIDQIDEVKFKIRELEGQAERSGGGLIGKWLGSNTKEEIEEQKALLAELNSEMDRLTAEAVARNREEIAAEQEKQQVKMNNIIALTEAERVAVEELILLREEESELEADILNDRYEKELDSINKLHDDKKISLQQYLAAVEGLNKKHDDIERNRREARARAEQQLRVQTLNQFGSFFGGMAAIASLGGKKLFGITKRLSQAEAIARGAVAVQNALAAPPGWPLNALGVIGATARAVANVVKINAVQLATGMDSVPGIGFQDIMPAILAPKERVVQRNTNQDLTAFLARENKAAGDVGGGGVQRARIAIEIDVDKAVPWLRAKLVEDSIFNTGEGLII